MKKEYLILILIIVLGFLLRFINISNLPPSLNWDEVSHGYNAYSILKTGQDEWGQWFPITNFRAYGDYPLPLYMYLSIPWIAILGLNEISIRLTSVLLGSLTVLMVYLISKQVFKNRYAALFSMLLLAVSPWGILTSRQVIQSTPAIFFLSLGIWLCLKGIAEKSQLLVWGAASMGLSAYAYHNTRILTPVLFFLLIIFFKKFFFAKKKFLIQIFIVGVIFFVPLIPVVFSTEGAARSSWVGILDQGAINQINEARSTSDLPVPLPKLLNNKIVYSSIRVAENYLGYFSPIYLGLEGGTQYQFSVPHFGIIYPIELPFFYIGLIFLLAKFRKNSLNEKFILGWLLLAPIPAAITRDPYQVVRSTIMMPALYIVTGLGVALFLDKFKSISLRNIIVIIFIVLLGWCSYLYLNNLWNDYPKQYSSAWQYGYKQAFYLLQTKYNNYSQVLITKKYGEPHEFLLFYSQYDPQKYRSDPTLVRYQKSNWFWVDQFDKYYFINDWEVKEKLKGKNNLLLITSPGNYPQGGKVLETINFLDGSPAFDIVAL